MTDSASRRVEVVPYDPAWPRRFEGEAGRIEGALGTVIQRIDHIGSTAIPTIHAKPIVDLLVQVDDLDRLDNQTAKMESLDYTAMGEFGITGRRYFRKSTSKGTHLFHVHAFLVDSILAIRHLAFRDYLRSFPDDAQRYSALKVSLASRHPTDIQAYMDGKHTLIVELLEKALTWRARSKR